MEGELSDAAEREIYKSNDEGTFTVAGKTFDGEIDDYYFESDTLALRENPDYCKLLKAVAVLEAQRIKAIKDLDRLIEIRHGALIDPVAFVQKLQRKEELNLPRPQKVYDLPDIDWDKYTTKLGSLTHKHMTRNKKPTTSTCNQPAASTTVTDHSSPAAPSSIESRSAAVAAAAEVDDASAAVVRGRVLTMGKPQTFNQLWTCEEQRKLERLLVEYPPEAVEARRWEKIANALGNRTPLQVASRVQKYFIKLTKAGLPVPGRIPNVNTCVKRSGGVHRHQRHNRLLFSRSTFFASHEPPVYMSEYDDDGAGYSNASSTDGDSNWTVDNDYDNFHRELNTSQDFKDYVYQKNRRRRRRSSGKHSEMPTGPVECYLCHLSPIVGTRWRCIDCPHPSFYLCNNCYTHAVDTPTHRSHHRLEAITEDESAESHIDEDYTSFQDGFYNYLDPNFIPDA